MNTAATLSLAGWSPARFTADEFATMIGAGLFADRRVELVQGELREMPPAGNRHARRHAAIAYRLIAALGEAMVRVEVAIRLDHETIAAPDAAVLRRDVVEDGPIAAADVLMVVEVADTSLSYDVGVKRTIYATAGIAHYWVVDARRSVVHVYGTAVADDYETLVVIAFGEPLTVPGTDAVVTID